MTFVLLLIFRFEDAAQQQLCVSVCLSEFQVEILSQFEYHTVPDSTRQYQTVPDSTS